MHSASLVTFESVAFRYVSEEFLFCGSVPIGDAVTVVMQSLHKAAGLVTCIGETILDRYCDSQCSNNMFWTRHSAPCI